MLLKVIAKLTVVIFQVDVKLPFAICYGCLWVRLSLLNAKFPWCEPDKTVNEIVNQNEKKSSTDNGKVLKSVQL